MSDTPTIFTKSEWINILNNKEVINEVEKEILVSFGKFKNGLSSGSIVAKKYGYKNAGAISLYMMHLAKRIAKTNDLTFSIYKDKPSYWRLFFNGWYETPFYWWQLRSELFEALIELGLVPFQELESDYEIDEIEIFREGAKIKVETLRSERNAKARAKCIEHYGCKCAVCRFDFERTYGLVGKGFIHVHHLESVATKKGEYEIDPINDLIPLCPNCHSMIHARNPMYTVEELKELMGSSNS